MQENFAYVDSSAVVAVAFQEPGWQAVDARLRSFAGLISSTLLEAEVRSVYARERRAFNETILSRIHWVHTDRSLSDELATVLEVGYLRGADLYHVAVALFATPDPSSRTFLTLDNTQRAVAAALGFQT